MWDNYLLLRWWLFCCSLQMILAASLHMFRTSRPTRFLSTCITVQVRIHHRTQNHLGPIAVAVLKMTFSVRSIAIPLNMVAAISSL
ncbi:hypothetical protein FN846DRAFT_276571 [Sphaerosporella brunnea]|uniref:Secreted protein n=1 Tax=Sphaerosporella brunnea TaxID=1250544 RepID=A0A5J5EM62_9PEZI|nr:hypothetical protein FN846DRAFT_276571 [Sphaerosporella brunnea]